MLRSRDVLFAALGLGLGLVVAARVSAAPIVVNAPPGTSPSMAPMLPPYPAPTEPGRSSAAAGCALQVTRVSDNTLVSVRDEGESQLVFVYTFDEAGRMQPVPQKARFFYKF